jgi:hypothetical protein
MISAINTKRGTAMSTKLELRLVRNWVATMLISAMGPFAITK